MEIICNYAYAPAKDITSIEQSYRCITLICPFCQMFGTIKPNEDLQIWLSKLKFYPLWKQGKNLKPFQVIYNNYFTVDKPMV